MKNAPIGCDRSKAVTAKSLTSSTSNKKQKLAPPSSSSSSENDEESEQGEVYVPNSDDSVSRDSSTWDGSSVPNQRKSRIPPPSVELTSLMNILMI